MSNLIGLDPSAQDASNDQTHCKGTSRMSKMDRNLALEAVRVTEAGALSAVTMMGRGDEKQADQAAVNAIRQALNNLDIDGTVVIGEGERDEAPMLYIGEKVGSGKGPKIDIALDPLEGTTITAKGGQNALAVMAMADAGGFLNAPDTYMEKNRHWRRLSRRLDRSDRHAGKKTSANWRRPRKWRLAIWWHAYLTARVTKKSSPASAKLAHALFSFPMAMCRV